MCAFGLKPACVVKPLHVLCPYALKGIHVLLFGKICNVERKVTGQRVSFHSQVNVCVFLLLVFPYEANVAEFLTFNHSRMSYLMIAPYLSPGKCKSGIFLFYFVGEPFTHTLGSPYQIPYDVG